MNINTKSFILFDFLFNVILLLVVFLFISHLIKRARSNRSQERAVAAPPAYVLYSQPSSTPDPPNLYTPPNYVPNVSYVPPAYPSATSFTVPPAVQAYSPVIVTPSAPPIAKKN